MVEIPLHGPLVCQNGVSNFSMKLFIFLLGLFGTEGKPDALVAVQNALEECEDGKATGLFQKFHERHVRHHRHFIEREDPLKKRIYLVFATHKAGTVLLRNIMRWIFDSLGATDSCNYGHFEPQITSKATLDSRGFALHCAVHPVNLRCKFNKGADTILELRQQTADKERFRGVTTIRDPFEMIVSAYCCLGCVHDVLLWLVFVFVVVSFCIVSCYIL